MYQKKITAMLAAICVLGTLSACNGDEQQNENSDRNVTESKEDIIINTEAPVTTTETSRKSSNVETRAFGTAKADTAFEYSQETATVKPHYTHSNKAFKLEGYTTSLFMENGWEIASGGTATEQQTDKITSLPAVIQYLDTANTITITVGEECEPQEIFLANTEDDYIAVYGNEFDSIQITDFSLQTIDEYDSFEIKADVVILGVSYQMTHILTNDVSGRTFSWMMLDSDGTCSGIHLSDAISYPKTMPAQTVPAAVQDALDRIGR